MALKQPYLTESGSEMVLPRHLRSDIFSEYKHKPKPEQKQHPREQTTLDMDKKVNTDATYGELPNFGNQDHDGHQRSLPIGYWNHRTRSGQERPRRGYLVALDR